MGKLKEILDSGIAPSAHCGNTLSPAATAALRGLKEIESEPIYKGGPTRGARRIEKYFQLGKASDIRKKWSTPFSKTVAIVSGLAYTAFLLLGGIRTAEAGYITPGESFTDGQTVHAQDLNNAIGNATIGTGFISSQGINNSALGSDYLIEYSPSLSGLFKITISQLISSPQQWIGLSQGYPNYLTNDLFNFYSQGNGQAEAITATNLLNFIGTNLPVAKLSFAPTNRNNGATNLFALTSTPYSWSGTYSLNQPEFLLWNTNGIPYQVSLSNLEAQEALDFNTNGSMYGQTFLPYLYYGTNNWFTNALGFTNDVPITNLQQIVAGGGTNVQSLHDGDTVPVQASSTGTNTTATLLALSQYFQKNFSIARIQFGGATLQVSATNWNATTGIITNFAGAIAWSNVIVAVSFKGTNGTIGSTSPAITSNTLFYVTETNGVPIGYQVFTTYNNALTRTSPILGVNVTPLQFGEMLLVTNITSYNADIIQDSGINAISTGKYDIYFRTNPVSPLYYVSSSILLSSTAQADTLELSADNIITTNNVRIQAQLIQNAAAPQGEAPTLAQVIIQNQ